MRNTSGRILKGADVKLEGHFTLDIMQTEAESSKLTSTALVEPQVRVVESESDFSVIEITCSCGESMRLKCEYAGNKIPEIPSQDDEPEETNQEK